MFEDLSVFFSTSEFAIQAQYTEKIYTHPSSNTIPLKGQFMNRYIETSGISGTRPVFTCVASDVPKAARGDFLTINNVNYLIDVPQNDGTGVLKIILEKV